MVAFIQSRIIQLLEIIGLDESNFKIFLCALLSFPFSAIFKRLPDNRFTLKNMYNVSVSAFYIFGILNLYSGLMTLLISSVGCYLITRYVRTPSMPWINYLFLMSHLAYNHIHAQFFNDYDATQIDITGAQMVLVMKLSSFGWSVHDGKQPESLLSPYTKSRAIKEHPNILPFIGYVFFYASLLTGPAFDYADYDKFIHGTLFDDVPESKRPGKAKRRIPRSGTVALKKVIQGVFWAVLFLKTSPYFDAEYVLSGALVKEHGFIYRIFYFWIWGFTFRLKYYTIWTIAEGACILSGIGYNGYDAETDSFKWNRVQNIDPWAFETGQNVHTCLESWNMNTNKWLKNYVYFRIAKKGKKPGFKSTLFTFATSAFWHGTRPGYYLTFVQGALMQSVGKIFRRNFRPMFLEKDGKTPKSTKKYYDIVCYFVTQLAFGYTVLPFVILDFKPSVYCWSTTYFYVPIGTMVTIFLFKGPYGKTVTTWCRSHQAAAVYQAEQEKRKLTSTETTQVTNAFQSILEKEPREKIHSPLLGLPSLEDLEAVDKDEIDEEIKLLGDAWKSFRGRRSSITQDDFEGLKDAYNNFSTEINEIFSKRTEDIKKDVKSHES